MGADKALTIKCKATINGEQRYVTGLIASISVDGFWPTVTLITHPKKDAETKAMEMGTSDVAKEMGKIQKKIFQSRSSPDCTVNVSVEGDSSAGSFSFKGLLIGGSYGFSAYNVEKTDSAVPDYALISALSYSVYKQHIVHGDDGTKPEFSGDIANFIKECGEELEKSWQDNKNNEGRVSYKVAKTQHQVNQKAKKFFNQLMQASSGNDKIGWENAKEVLQQAEMGGDVELRRRVMDILLNSDGPFETTISQLAEEFQCIYVPTWEKIGYFKNRRNLLKNKKSLSVDVIQLQLEATNGRGLFPIKYAAVCPMLPEEWKLDEGPADFIAAPEENVKEGGSMLRTQGPLWVTASATQLAIDSQGKEAPRRKKSLKVNKAKQVPKKATKKLKNAYEKLLDVFKEWGEAEYVYQSLAGSRATIVTTLNFKPEVGNFYSVKSKSGGEILSGLLAGITHFITTGNGKGPNCYTELHFSHIQLSGFTLPGAPQ